MISTPSGRYARWVATTPGEQTLVLNEVTVGIRRDHDAACLVVDGKEIVRRDVIPSKFIDVVRAFKAHVKAQYDHGIWPPK
jgi:hypothetical protein